MIAQRTIDIFLRFSWNLAAMCQFIKRSRCWGSTVWTPTEFVLPIDDALNGKASGASLQYYTHI